MIPIHQKIIDDTLHAAYALMAEHVNALGYPVAEEKQFNQEHLCNSQLARDLTMIAHYIEGYQVEENPQQAIERVCRVLFGCVGTSSGYVLPKKFHQTKLGELIYAAYELLIPKDQLMTTDAVKKVLGVERQTVYDWVEEGKLTPYYVKGKQMFYRPHIQKQAQRRAEMLRRKQVGIKDLQRAKNPLDKPRRV